jgi:hypothetical protein
MDKQQLPPPPAEIALDIFDAQWLGYHYYWTQHAKQCDNMQRMLQGTSPLDFLEDDVRTDWHRLSYRLGCALAA